jgi:predicted dinucleotide-binding enzyme
MKFAVMGTGQVGGTIGRRLHALGHDVVMGSRNPGGDNAAHFTREIGIRVAGHAEAAEHGEWIVNALPGEQAIAVLGRCAIAGKILIDIANYDHAVDQPIAVPLGQAIQSAFPDVRLVKTLNSVSAHLMVDPAALGAEHHVFVASDDEAAKAEVTALLRTFGWQSILDLGDLGACRAMEQLIPLWMRLEATFGGPDFNLAVVRGRG